MTTDTAGVAAVDDPGPVLTVVRGEPTAEQVAALIAVLSARTVQGNYRAAARRSLWATPALRTSRPAGPGAWRASSLPE